MSSNIQSDHVAIDILRTRFSTVEASSIRNLVMNEDRILLQNLGGVEGIVEALETDVENGIVGDASDRYSRRRKFGHNFCPEFKPVKCFKHVALEAFTDPMIIILLVCCALSLVLGITRNGLKRGWHEGLSNLAAILVVVAISAGCNFWLTNLCLNHSDKSSNVPHVDVVRNRRWQQLSIPRLAVGDVVFLKPGDHVPADGLFLDGSLLCVANLTIDGEIEYENVNSQENPFLHYGRWVVDGHAKMLITGVGNHKTKHEILFNNGTLVDEFKNLTSVIAQIGRGAAVLTFLALLVRLFAGNIFDNDGNRVSFYGEMKFIDGVSAMVGIIATPVMMALTSSPEGLMFAVKFTLTYSMRKLDHADVFVRKPSICQSVASVTTICVNKTATLTKDDIKVTKFWLGPSSIEEVRDKSIAPNVLELLHQGIGLNTSPLPSGSLSASPKNPTEKAIFEWAVEELDMDVETLKESCTVVDIEPFNSTKKQSRVLISRNADKTNHEHRKGAAEVIISMCSHYYEHTGTVKVINHNAKVQFEQILEEMAKSGLRCIAFAHRNTSARDYFTPSDKQFNLLGIMGLENPPRTDGIKRTLEECLGARVKVKLITGDNISTAKSVATKCGILESSYQPEEIVEGQVFQNYTPEERLEKVETIRVMARATPSDKLLMVQCLKEKGHVVAYLGRGTGDVEALRNADVGICFGTKGAETIKAGSDILTLSRDVPLVLVILRWGRSIYDNIQIYTQFLLTASFLALVSDVVMLISSSEPAGFNAVAAVSAGRAPYPVFPLMWLKLILGTLATLAIVMKPPSQELLHKPPRDRNEPVMTAAIPKFIYAQGVYQSVILLSIHFWGKSIFKLNSREKDTIIFNTYILCQIFAIFKASLVDKNMFYEIRKNKWSWGIIVITIIIQVLLVEVLKIFAGTVSLDWEKWGICISIAAVTLPINRLIKCVFDMQKPSFSRFIWFKRRPKVN